MSSTTKSLTGEELGAKLICLITSCRSRRTIRRVANYLRQQVSASCNSDESMRRTSCLTLSNCATLCHMNAKGPFVLIRSTLEVQLAVLVRTWGPRLCLCWRHLKITDSICAACHQLLMTSAPGRAARLKDVANADHDDVLRR